MKAIIFALSMLIFSAHGQTNKVTPVAPAMKQDEKPVKIKSKKTPPKQLEAPKHPETVLEKASDAAEKTVDATQKAVEDVKESAAETRNSRENNKYFGYVMYSPIDLIIPSKIGASLGYNKNADTTFELEYLKGSVAVPFLVKDLGNMSDERVSIIVRSYMGSNSFNVSYGLSYFDFTVHLGDAVLNRMTYGKYPSIDLLEIQSLGLNVGIGNRWTFAKNLSFGVDWISWSQPVYTISRKSDFLQYASSQSDKDDVDKLLRWVGNFPRLTLLKLQLGISF